jgi:hypothetical protein
MATQLQHAEEDPLREQLDRIECHEQAAWREAFPGRDLGVFHLAYFGDRLCLFHRGGLAASDPEAWQALVAIARRLDAALVVDRREREADVAQDRRRTALALTVAAGLMMRSAVADDGYEAHAAVLHMPEVVELSISTAEHSTAAAALELPAVRSGTADRRLTVGSDGRLRIGRAELGALRRVDGSFRLHAYAQSAARARAPCLDGEVDTAVAQGIESLLLERLADKPDASLREAIGEVSNYYARYPEVVQLFAALARQPWVLEPKAETWLTKARLRNGQVRGVTVLFDLETAAQMHFAKGCAEQPACTAMPADAFLHELLHVYVIHSEPSSFVKAAADSYYPHAHENEVIALENRLYRAMEARDGLPRPARHSHAGKLTQVDCPLCWASGEARGDLQVGL